MLSRAELALQTKQEVYCPVITSRVQYLKQLGSVVSNITEITGGNKWWVIGGIARDAIIGNRNFSFVDCYNQTRDTDILLSTGCAAKAPEIRSLKTQIPLGVRFHNFIEVSASEATLCFGRIKKPVSPDLFDTQIVQLGDVPFPTLPALTLQHIYLIDGKMRPKDFQNCFTFSRYIFEMGLSKDEEKYRVFHNFLRERDTQFNFTKILMNMVRKYRNSPLHSLLPFTHPKLYPLVECVWHRLSF